MGEGGGGSLQAAGKVEFLGRMAGTDSSASPCAALQIAPPHPSKIQVSKTGLPLGRQSHWKMEHFYLQVEEGMKHLCVKFLNSCNQKP